jgi:hypothetical protein
VVCHGYTPAAPGPHGYNPLGILPISNDTPERSEILPNYPNPSSFMTNIPYNIKTGGLTTLEVYSITGEKVTTLMNGVLQPGKYKAEFYTSKLSPGTYICTLIVNGARDSKKISVVK